MKLVLDIKGPIKEGDILVFRNGSFVPVKITELLPDYKLISKINDLEAKVKELRGED